MKTFIDADSKAFQQSGDYLERPRLYELLKKAVDYPLVIVCAGSGYGKTQAVYSFLKKYDAVKHWMQISERDNIAARFWENFTGIALLFSPKIGTRLIGIGFPDKDEAFAKYAEIRREVAAQPGKYIMVLDDFHLLHNPSVIRFFERMVKTSPPNMTIIIISRTMPEINLIGMIMRGQMVTIEEDTLCFTENEIAEYFNQLKLPVARRDIRDIYDDTQGWAFALNLIGRSLAQEKKYDRYALKAMKNNIFQFIDAEISQTVSESLFSFLLRISLIDHLAASLVNTLAKGEALIREMEALNAFIRYDFNMDTYLIHHLLLDYLRQKQNQVLTDEERRETYQTAAAWCDASGYHIDALSYYEKSGDHEAIIRKITSLNVQLPYDTARYALDILDSMPASAKSRIPLFPAMHLKLKLNLGQFEETQVIAEQYAEDYESRPETPERNLALTAIYAFWGLLRMKMCTYADVYDFDAYFKKMAEYFNKNPFKTIGAYRLVSKTSRASLVGTSRPGALEEYIGAVSRAIPYLSQTLNGFYEGFEDLVRGELCFYREEYIVAEQYFKQSIGKAREYDQYVTQNRALVYLMHIDIFHGDYIAATAKLEEMETLLSEKDYGVRYTIYDIAYSFYLLALEQPEQIPKWLKEDFSPYAHPSYLENYANRVKARYHYQTHRYDALLAFIENAMKRPAIIFDKIDLLVLDALSLYRLNRYGEAIAMFSEAYHLTESNGIIVPFIQYANDMRTFTAAALRDADCRIPRKWLEDITHKSSALAKRKAKMISEYKKANDIEEETQLTERETKILEDLSRGVSRIEVAAGQNVSVNTVKLATNIIYNKLGANSLADAVRIAAKRKII